MKRFFFLIGMSFLLINTVGANSYIWNVTNGSWTVANNWTPSRTTPATDDILIFDGNIISQCTAIGIIPQSLGQLKVMNGCTVVFTAPSPATLNFGTIGLSFLIDSTSQLHLGGSFGITLSLPSISVGTIYGSVVFEQSANVHVLTSATTNGIVFASGASFQNAPKATLTNSPFAGLIGFTTTANSVVFQSGATYYHAGTSGGYSNGTACNPYTFSAPSSVVVFQPGSLFYIWDPTNLNFSGRTVSNITFDARASNLSFSDVTNVPFVITDTCRFKSTSNQILFGGNFPISIGGDFIIESGSGGLKDNPSLLTPTNFEVKGNFTCAGTFIPSANMNRIYLLDGNSAQTLTLSASSTTIPNLSVNNGSDITLGNNISIISTLTMNAGNINTGSNSLVLGVSTTQIGTLNRTSGTIIGKFTRWVSALTTGTYAFPIGTLSNLNEATINFSIAPSTGGTLTTFFTASNPGTLGLPTTDGVLSLDTMNPGGFWTINSGNGLSGGTYNVTLETNGFTFINSTTNARILKRTNNVSPWTALGNPGTNNGVDIVRTGLSGFSDFGIAENSTGGVPVELSDFSFGSEYSLPGKNSK